MNTQLLIPSIGAALAVVCFAMGLLFVARAQANKRVRERLQDVILVGEGDTGARSVILRDLQLSSLPFFNDLLKSARWAQKLDNLLVQGDISMRLGAFLLLMAVLGAAGFTAMIVVFHRALLALPVGIVAAWAPLLYARQRRFKRIRKFEEQFPDALDMLNRALRAGLALNGAIQIVADESPDPVAKEFRVLFEENRLGLDMKEALKKLAGRVDSTELHLFVTAVILQRETGGNLAEILERTALIIRDRFRILGDIRTLTAQARLSGFILTVLPIVMAVLIYFVAPEYLKGLVADQAGRLLIAAAVALQVIGFLVIRRIIDIKV
jgi:tight adherence protein B